jgi:hypothetical protein
MTMTSPRARAAVAGFAAAAVMAAGGAVAAAGAAAHRAAPGAAAHRAALAAQARASLLRYLRGARPFNVPGRGGGPRGVTPSTVNARAGAQGAGATGSYNWSGYADTAAPGSFTAVSGRWRQPAAFCGGEQELAAFWVGLDGLSDATVEQDGTLAYCFEGQPYYYSWWEMYPGNSVTVGSSVLPGDLIAASVTRSGASYTLALTDVSHPANSFSTVQACGACQDSSAEWIAERPAFPIGITPLAFFTGWTLASGSQTSDGTTASIGSGPSVTSITMVDATDSYALDSISPLFAAGSSFGAGWQDSY